MSLLLGRAGHQVVDLDAEGGLQDLVVHLGPRLEEDRQEGSDGQPLTAFCPAPINDRSA